MLPSRTPQEEEAPDGGPISEARIALASLDGFLNTLMEDGPPHSHQNRQALSMMRQQTARLRNLLDILACQTHQDAANQQRHPYRLKGLVIHHEEQKVDLHGNTLDTTATEFRLLTTLASAAGRILTYQYLSQAVWNQEFDGNTYSMRTAVKALRQKLQDDARHPTWIFNQRGIGYSMPRGEPTPPGDAL